MKKTASANLKIDARGSDLKNLRLSRFSSSNAAAPPYIVQLNRRRTPWFTTGALVGLRLHGKINNPVAAFRARFINISASIAFCYEIMLSAVGLAIVQCSEFRYYYLLR